jgi:hypothetical protein
VDVGAAQVAAAEEDVGVGADDHVGAGRDQLGGEGALAVDGAVGQLPAPVEVDDHGVGACPGRADGGQEARLLVRRGHAGLAVAGGPGAARLLSRTWVAPITAMRWPLTVTRWAR